MVLPKIHVSPQSSQKAPFQQITRNSPTIFQFGPREMETSNFAVNCVRSAQFTDPPSKSCEISAIHANS